MATHCKTCWGYGLWADGTAPMGPMDSRDGYKTSACPECGMNPNPKRTLVEVYKEKLELENQGSA